MSAKVSQGSRVREPERTVAFADREEWAAWLEREHATSAGVWLKLGKKGSPTASLRYAEALEEALVWGWIDAQKRPLDEHAWLQRFTRRAPRSAWSRINREKAALLLEQGRMQPPGLAEVERARADGRWERAYDPPSRAEVPDDLRVALEKSPRAARFFATLDAANRYAILYRVQTAKRDETRHRRITQFVAMLAKGEKIHA
jgi:uncharacterized protein YdeI (YjbR/CyaY-like superfamily)